MPQLDPDRRVLGVIRPTAEVVGDITKSRHVGILATTGTIMSHSYDMEIQKLFPDIVVSGRDCPMWVPLVENFEFESPGADYFVKLRINQILEKDPQIDTLVLACTHYPLLKDEIEAALPPHVRLIIQGDIVASKTVDYLNRHPEMEVRLSKGGKSSFLTTDTAKFFEKGAFLFGMQDISAKSLTF